MCLLLDHGLRVGEVATLQVSDFDLENGELRFYRSNVDKVQTHKLSADTMRAAIAYFDTDVPETGLVLLGSIKGGNLTNKPMSERAITKRVKYLGRVLLGIHGLSAHDCRHYWATDAARNGTDPFRLQEAGGWSSLIMPRRYVEDAKIANKGVKLSS
jgi:integrase